MIYDSIADTIGNTPVVRLGNMAPDHVEMYVKIEGFNPKPLPGIPASASPWCVPPRAIHSSP